MNEIIIRVALEPGCSKAEAIKGIREAADRAAGQIEHALLPWPLDLVQETYLIHGHEDQPFTATIQGETEAE